MNFFPIIVGSGSAARFFEKGVGDTQKNIRAEADKCKGHGGTPCCMFVDEFDSLGADRRDDVSILLTFFFCNQYNVFRNKDTKRIFLINSSLSLVQKIIPTCLSLPLQTLSINWTRPRCAMEE